MPIENSFRKGEALLSPCSIASPIPGFPETVIITFSDRMEIFLQESHKTSVIAALHAGDTRPIYCFTHQRKRLGLYRTGLGGSASAALMEEVLVMGAKRILVFGSCGTLEKGIAEGRLILPTHAYRDEGTSYHYLPADDFIDVPTHNKLSDVFTDLNIPFISGKTWTTDAFYRETAELAKVRREQGCIAVEMECASLMAVGKFRNKEIYQFLYAADSLSGDKWEARILGKTPDDLRRAMLRIALDTAAALTPEETE
ncbi:MAG: nucleoside phosphorylase [Clostridia bacterium]|nr:nucleoside phosphorylase [Clostridia bacterium]